jgi:hypothetical protein
MQTRSASTYLSLVRSESFWFSQPVPQLWEEMTECTKKNRVILSGSEGTAPLDSGKTRVFRFFGLMSSHRRSDLLDV